MAVIATPSRTSPFSSVILPQISPVYWAVKVPKSSRRKNKAAVTLKKIFISMPPLPARAEGPVEPREVHLNDVLALQF